MTRGNVEEGDLVCARVAVTLSYLNGVACVAYIQELHAFYDAAVLTV
jgi:hypothetical protein